MSVLVIAPLPVAVPPAEEVEADDTDAVVAEVAALGADPLVLPAVAAAIAADVEVAREVATA